MKIFLSRFRAFSDKDQPAEEALRDHKDEKAVCYFPAGEAIQEIRPAMNMLFRDFGIWDNISNKYRTRLRPAR